MLQDNFRNLNMDAFSDGQMASKLWLCQTLEDLYQDPKRFSKVWVYGSWYGTLPFLLLIRQKFQFQSLSLFDIDAEALAVSRKVLDHWKHSGNLGIQYFHHDCSSRHPEAERPDLVINTSCEHFKTNDWWDTVPVGAVYAVQSTNFVHPEHINTVQNLAEFEQSVKSARPLAYRGEKHFEYLRLKFDRFMMIGEK